MCYYTKSNNTVLCSSILMVTLVYTIMIKCDTRHEIVAKKCQILK